MPISDASPYILFAWRGSSLLVTDPRGDCGAHPLTGYYFREVRFLNTLQLEIDRPGMNVDDGGAEERERRLSQ